MSSNPFVLPAQEYKRDLDIVGAYVTQTSFFLHRQTGRPLETCKQFIRGQLRKDGKFPLKNPPVLALKQISPGNRERVDESFLGYIQEVVDTNRILSPSMVCYERPEVNKSTSAAYIEGGIKGRKVAKGEMFDARQAGDFVLEYIKDCEQNAKKIGINAVSGMHGFSGNILYVKSGHSSLTSMCRTATGYGNANNEKLITGSRHYWSPDITLSNILAIVTNTDYEQLQAAMQQYRLHYPNVEETMQCIVRSTSLYWRNDNELKKIADFVEKLEPIERAAFVYIGDLYHLMQYNESFVREFMDAFILGTQTIYLPVDKFDEVLKSQDDDTKALTNYLNADLFTTYMDETGKEQSKTRDYLKKHEPENYAKLAITAASIKEALVHYTPFIRAFLVPKILPPTVANIRSIIRRTALASDTDSTIFTTQEWVKWYTGTYDRTKPGDGIWYTMTYIATQCIIHVLAQFSANMGVSPGDLHRLSMKNEYAFPVFALTSRAKHYFAFMSAREGNVYAEYDMEIKGVALRSSIVPINIILRAKQLMEEILTTADKGEQFSVKQWLREVWRYEQDIRQSIEKGEPKYLKSAQIKESYKNMESSPYQQYLLWEEVFAPKYGNTPPPPYSAIKVPLEINNKTEMKSWLAAIEDKELASRLAKYLNDRNRDKLTTLMLPTALMTATGMPKEVMQVINIRKLTFEILESFYLLLECLGLHVVDSKFRRLVSDIYEPGEEIDYEKLA